MRPLEKLLSPVKLGEVWARNRIVMAPMTTGWADPDGYITQRLIDYHEARAKGGVGTIILELATIDRFSSYPRSIGLWDDRFIPGLRELAEAVHAYGAKLLPQIAHPGPDALSFLYGVQPVGPSPLVCRTTKQVCRELALREIEGIVEQFGEAASRAKEAGCDGIELHAAHSYQLVGSFLSALRNKRSDAFGGSLEGRLKLALEVVSCVRTKVGSDFVIVMRISGDELVPGGRGLRETQYMVPMLAEAGVDAFEISGGAIPDLHWWINPPMGTPLGLNVAFSAAIKKVVDVPVIAVGRINDARLAEDVLRRNEADLVAMGRALLTDPELPKKAAEGRFEDIVPCIGCSQGCFGEQEAGRPMTCLMNPAVGREREMAIVPAARKKTVLVAGGGPAGLEAARIAALRGHRVTLFERTEKLGGQFNLAAVPPLKQEICGGLRYLSMQAFKAGVQVELGSEVTLQLIEEMKPDVLIVATGGRPLIPALPGADGSNVVTAHEVLNSGKPARARNVIVIGGGMVGCEVADLLADRGDNPVVGHTAVTIVEMLRDVCLDMPTPNRMLLMERMRRKGVRVITSAAVKEILDDGVVFIKDGQEVTMCGMDCIILAVGTRSVDTLSEVVKHTVGEVYVIGDAAKPRKALEAITEGAETGMKI